MYIMEFGSTILIAVLGLSSSLLGPVWGRGLASNESASLHDGGTKIFGGGKAAKTSFRYTVWIELKGDFVCGASLLTENWVLTAASCLLDQTGQPRKFKDFRIWVGDYNLLKSQNEFKAQPTFFAIHPDCITTGCIISNIALVKLSRPAPLKRKNIALVPALAPSDLADADLAGNNFCFMTGWGKKPGGKDQTKMRLIAVEISPTGCPSGSQSDMCYDPTPGGACDGDVGNPVMCIIGGMDVQVGVNVGRACAAEITPATRIATFRAWIDTYLLSSTVTPPVTTPTPVCTQFAAPDNGQVTFTGLAAGDTAQILCDADARLSVYHSCNAQSTCQPDGSWSPDITGVTCDPVCDSTGTSFMFGYLQNIFSEGTLYLYVVASGPTDLTIEYPLLSDDPVNLEQITEYLVTQLSNTLAGSGRESSNKGIRLTASAPVSVYIHNYRPGNGPSADGTLVMPENCLSDVYFVVAHNTGPQDAIVSALMVIATEDNTDVNFGVLTGDNPPPQQMNAFDTYHFTSPSLSGALILANKDVVVMSGHVCASVPDRSTRKCDHIMEHLPSVYSLGTDYIVTNFNPRPNYSLRIIGTSAGTVVTFSDRNGDSFASNTIGASDVIFEPFQTLTRNFVSADIMSITATQPILVAQYSEGTTSDTLGFGDPSMVILPALNQFRKSYRVYAPSPALYNQNWVSITLPVCYGIGRLLINGVQVPTADAHIIDVPGIGSYAVYYQEIEDSLSLITHRDDTGLDANFGVIQYGFNKLVQYAWAAGRVY